MKERGISHLSDFAGKKDIDTAVIIAYERSEALKTDLERDDDNESEKDFGEDEKLVQGGPTGFYTGNGSVLQGVRKTNSFPTYPLSLASLVRSDSYFTC